MNIVFQIEGGISQNVAATAVCSAVKQQFPHDMLVVVTNHPAVFLCNPHIHRVLSQNDHPYFYSTYIAGQEVRMMLHHPFADSAYINGGKHLLEVWCSMYGLPYGDSLPEVYLTAREIDFSAQLLAGGKPIFVIQTNGGSDSRQTAYNWVNDLPLSVAQQVVDAFLPTHQVVHIKRENQPPLKGTVPFQSDFRTIAAIIALSDKRLFINSFCQHVAAALGKPSVVCWVGSDPVQQGYDIHTNLVANAPTLKPDLRNSVFLRYRTPGQSIEFPYRHEGELFDVPAIIAALHEETPVTGGSKKKNNLLAKEKILKEGKKGSMVAQRLAHLVGVSDLSDIKQILDIGSWHLGQSIEFATIFPDARIDAFEPVPESFHYCTNRLASLDAKKRAQIRLHNTAIGDIVGEIPFYPVDPAASSVPNVGASSMFRFKEGLNGTPFGQHLVQREILVQATTLDQWCEAHDVTEVDMMWVDVQGAELHVFRGAEQILKKTRILLTEVGLKPYYEGHTMKAEIDEFLFGLGFRELQSAYEINVKDYEANVIYIRE